MSPRPSISASIALLLMLLGACDRPPVDDAAGAHGAQKLPFDRPTGTTGISPSQSIIPSATRLPEGTAISVRLEKVLSSASSHAGDSFNTTLEEPVVIEGLTLLAAGYPATGRVLEAKPSTTSAGGAVEPGYLRIVLTTVNAGDKPVMIETSSIFAKGGSHDEKAAATGSNQKDVVLAAGRRLSFHLAQSVDLQ